MAEQEHTRAVLLDPLQQVVEDGHLSGILDDVKIGGEGRARFHSIKEVGVIAALAQLHNNVQEPGFSFPFSKGTYHGGQKE